MTEPSGYALEPIPQAPDFTLYRGRQHGGSGMVLRIRRSIVESHGGRLWAAANSPRGANFYFTLSAKGQVSQ